MEPGSATVREPVGLPSASDRRPSGFRVRTQLDVLVDVSSPDTSCGNHRLGAEGEGFAGELIGHFDAVAGHLGNIRVVNDVGAIFGSGTGDGGNDAGIVNHLAVPVNPGAFQAVLGDSGAEFDGLFFVCVAGTRQRLGAGAGSDAQQVAANEADACSNFLNNVRVFTKRHYLSQLVGKVGGVFFK